MRFKRIITLGSLLLMPVYYSMAYSFSDSSGLKSFAGKTGHTKQKIFSNSEGIASSIGTIIQYLLSFLGVIFMALIIYGGVLWMTARGNEKQLEKAKSIITEAVIGLIIVVSAYAISVLVMKTFNFQ